MLVEYWLAGYIGRAWLWLRRGLRSASGDLPGLCAAVARRESVPAGTLWKVQDFAEMAWWGVSLAAIGVALVGGLAADALYGGAVPLALIVSAGPVLISLAGIAAPQAIMIRYRSTRLQMYLRTAGAAAGWQPLPRGSLGLPRMSDFWAVLALAGAGTAILLYAGLYH
jgi:hypothetical protein